MKKRKYILLVFGLLCSLLLVSTALAAITQSVDWSVIAGGGGQAESADGSIAIHSTLGQPIVGTASNGNTQLCAGYQCGTAETAALQQIYLPVIQR